MATAARVVSFCRAYSGSVNRKPEDDAPDHTADEPEDKGSVVPEAGEGPIPPVAGDPRPPIGN